MTLHRASGRAVGDNEFPVDEKSSEDVNVGLNLASDESMKMNSIQATVWIGTQTGGSVFAFVWLDFECICEDVL